jgi:hypothetical protein
MDLAERLQKAVETFWAVRTKQKTKSGSTNIGARGAVTGGAQLSEVEDLLVELLRSTGLIGLDIRSDSHLELPGYFRPEKKWDILILSQKKLVAAIELKSQVGPSFGNNFNNRTEEALGSAQDLWTAFREGRFGSDLRPFLGYFFLLEDCTDVHLPVRNAESNFPVEDIFRRASYSKRYEIFCQRLVRERLYDAACLTLSKNATPVTCSHPLPELSFQRFVAQLQGHAVAFVNSQASLPTKP